MTKGAILFIDDDPQILRALQRVLRSEAYQCRFVHSGTEAFEILQAEDIHVVVSDLNMPEINGLDLLARVEQLYPSTIRLVLSGSSDSNTIISSINKGSIYRYILKPWADDELKIVIQQALSLSLLQREKKELMARLETANQELEQKVVARTRQLLAEADNAEVGKYASQLVHNLNNSLNGIMGNLLLIEESLDESEPDRKEIGGYCESAKQAADYLSEIIASILFHVRSDQTAEKQAVDMNEIIESQLRFFELNPLYKYKVQKQIDLAENLPKTIADPIQMKQIIGNLVKNAIDAMEQSEEKKLLIQSRYQDDTIEIQIADSGTGIAEADMSKIFSPDFTTKPVGKGTGLGLSSVKEMLAAHRGEIRIESIPGSGTVVQIYLQPAD